ncbi:hypothetical protein PS938_03062 [Pseudomonas fluorescens]|uniref:Uncharacterized protein n=1 Tax=Pseudomonas fluorescens TaxID=294 RepID=A0A5E7U9W0_PSEFL|nr:hypothetical protein PS938_03062 [Pseudomonas fluorescens]
MGKADVDDDQLWFLGENRQMSMPIALVTVVHKLSIKVSSA